VIVGIMASVLNWMVKSPGQRPLAA